MWWKRNRWKVIVPLLIAAILAGVFWYGGDAPGLRGWTINDSAAGQDQNENAPAPSDGSNALTAPQDGSYGEPSAPSAASDCGQQVPEEDPYTDVDAVVDPENGGNTGGQPETDENTSAGAEPGDKEYSESNGMTFDPSTGKDQYLTDPVPEGKPLPVEPQDVEFSEVTHTCTLSVRCDTILDNIAWLDPEKVELVPEDGVLFPVTEVTFYEGESVFNVLQREMRKAGIHMEFADTPMYNSAYIEGIGNLYEFDCGELSGWMYKVNGWFPNYGCSRYQLQEGDVVEWVYTCDLGEDVGGKYAADG